MTAEQAMNILAGKYLNEVTIENDLHNGHGHEWVIISGSERYKYAPFWWGLKKTLWGPRFRCCGKQMTRAVQEVEEVCQQCEVKRSRPISSFVLTALCQECGSGISYFRL